MLLFEGTPRPDMSSYCSQLIRSSGFWQKQPHHEVHSVAALELSTVSHRLPQHDGSWSTWRTSRSCWFKIENSVLTFETANNFKPTWMRSEKKIDFHQLSKLHELRKIMWYNRKLHNSYRVGPCGEIVSVSLSSILPPTWLPLSQLRFSVLLTGCYTSCIKGA